MIEWRDIPGWEGRYFVSSDGYIRNSKGRELKQHITRLGYHTVGLSRPGKTSFQMRVHRAVGLAFIPNPHGKPDINHRDLNKSNNDVSNLEWVTHLENMQHANARGAFHAGVNERCIHKLSKEAVAAIRALAEAGIPPTRCAAMFGLDYSYTLRIINRQIRVLG